MLTVAEANYYEILDLKPSATAEEIKAAYLRFTKLVHPDKGGSGALFDQVKRAYETLSDPDLRDQYDRNGYVEQKAPDSEQAPGWRRTDRKPPRSSNAEQPLSENEQQDARDDVYDEPPASPPPPTSSSSNVETSTSGFQTSEVAKLFSTNPSWTLVISGVLLLGLGRAGTGFVSVGLLVLVAGFIGVLGRRKAAHRAAIERAGMASIDQMSGADFEHRMRVAFEIEGYTVYHVGQRGDFGAVLVLDAPGLRTVVQTKRWQQSVGPGAVQEVVASRAHYGANRAIVVTNSVFTKNAQALAKSNSVEMWDRGKLIDFLAAQEFGPPRSGHALFADEFRAGLPTAAKGVLVVIVGVLAAGAASSKSRRRRRR